MKNKGLVKIRKCILNILNIPLKSTNEALECIDNILFSKSESIANRNINKLYNMLPEVPIIDENFKIVANKKVKFNSNILNCVVSGATSGASGDISLCDFNQKSSILKKPRYKNSKLFKNSGDVQLTYVTKEHDEFFKEIIIHILLHCLQSEIKSCFTKYQIQTSIPGINTVIKGITPSGKKNIKSLMTVMDRLDYTLSHYLHYTYKNSASSYLTELHLFIMIAFDLYILQKSFRGFMHRDLHSENVMIKVLPKGHDINIILENNIDIKLNVNYKTYLIDFGLSYIDFGESEKCKTKLQMPNALLHIDGVYDKKPFVNRAHDLRLLFADVYYNQSKYISNELKAFLKTLFVKVETQYKNNKNFIYYKKEGNPHYFFYDDLIYDEDPIFFPINILRLLTSEIKHI